MDKDFSKLVEYLDQRFNNIDVQLASRAAKEDVNELKCAVDAYAKRADTYF